MIWISDIKEIGKILQEAGKKEEYQKIIELQQQLMDMQKNISDLENENKELKENFKIKENLTYRNNTYYHLTEGPYCTKCRDVDKILVRLKTEPSRHIWICPECKNEYNYTWKDVLSNVQTVSYDDCI